MRSYLVQEMVPDLDNSSATSFPRPRQVLTFWSRTEQADRVERENWHRRIDHYPFTFGSLDSYDAECVWCAREAQRASLSSEEEVVLQW